MSNVANSDFKIVCAVNKAYEFHDIAASDGDVVPVRRRIQGMASGIDVDREGEVMSRSVIESFKKTITEGIYLDGGVWSLVPLVSEHRKNGLGEPQWDQILGHLIDAWIDADWNLWIEAELDTTNPNANMLYEQLTRKPEVGKPRKLGLSIGGIVKDAEQVWDEQAGVYRNTYLAVDLSEVTVTSAPAYPTKYLAAMQKSVNWEKIKQQGSESMDNNVKHDENENIETPLDATDETAGIITAEEGQVAVEEPNTEVEEAVDHEAVVEQDVEEQQAEVVDDAAEDLEKSEGQVSETAEGLAVTTDAFAALTSTVNELVTRLDAMTEQFEKSVSQGLLFKPEPNDEKPEEVEEVENPETTEEVHPETEQVEEVVGAVVEPSGGATEVVEPEKAETAPVERSLDVAALLSGIEQLINNKISDLDKSFNAKIDELANEEVDKSIIPTRANKSSSRMMENDTESEFMEVIKTKRTFDAIDAAFE